MNIWDNIWLENGRIAEIASSNLKRYDPTTKKYFSLTEQQRKDFAIKSAKKIIRLCGGRI